MAEHNIRPVFDENSEVLILGSFPSVKSREAAFFYAHPQNRFWKVLAAVLGCETPMTIDEKKSMLLCHHIALWDVIASCKIKGSADATIEAVVPNDLDEIIRGSRIKRIFTNGGKANALYVKYIFPKTGIEAVGLPSTSPANAGYSLERLTDKWKIIQKELLICSLLGRQVK